MHVRVGHFCFRLRRKSVYRQEVPQFSTIVESESKEHEKQDQLKTEQDQKSDQGGRATNPGEPTQQVHFVSLGPHRLRERRSCILDTLEVSATTGPVRCCQGKAKQSDHQLSYRSLQREKDDQASKRET